MVPPELAPKRNSGVFGGMDLHRETQRQATQHDGVSVDLSGKREALGAERKRTEAFDTRPSLFPAPPNERATRAVAIASSARPCHLPHRARAG